MGRFAQITPLRDIEGFDYEAIAGKLNITRAAAKSRLHRAYFVLKQSLKGLDEVQNDFY